LAAQAAAVALLAITGRIGVLSVAFGNASIGATILDGFGVALLILAVDCMIAALT